jgi:tagatose-1,6-bisphosphate aldolase
MNPEHPDLVSYQQIVDFKCTVAAILSPEADGMLLDPVYGAAQTIASGALNPDTGLLVAVEKTGYAGDPTERQSRILPGWGVEKIARMGAAAVKLLVYYHPGASNSDAQEALVQQVAEDCGRYDLPFFLEPLSYSLDPGRAKLSSAEKCRVVIETARRLTPLGVDVLKAEFPLDIMEQPDEGTWTEACQALSEASATPWVLLSAGVGFDEFSRQASVACQCGASGVLAGRAVWKEAVQLTHNERVKFLHATAAGRLKQLARIAATYGKPWTEFHPNIDQSVQEGWYEIYESW